MINFTRRGEVEAKLYRHCDGYPGGVDRDLEAFFEYIEQALQGHSRRYSDPEYLAARFIVWDAAEHARKYHPNRPLDYTGLGVAMQDHGDIEYLWFVECDSDERPKVRHEEV